MTREKRLFRRRAVLQTISGAVVAGAAYTGVAGASNHCDWTVSSGDSIQSVIAGASSGETICVEPGTYAEDVTVNNELTLEGPNSGIPGDGSRGDEATIEGRVILTADGAELDGFDVSPPATESNQTSEAVRASNTPNDIVIANNVVRDFERDDPDGGFYGVDGINIFGGDANEAIENATVRQNKVQNVRNEDLAGAAGISIQGNVSDADIADNVVTDIAEEVTAYGFGVVIRGTGNHNEVPEDVAVVGNELTDVLSDPSSPYDGVGFEVEADGSGFEASENIIESNNLGIEVKVAADETVIDFNDIVDNTRRGALNVDNTTVDATDNWWGHASGPGGPDGRRNPAGREVGKGDDIEGDFDFRPWLRRSINSPSR
ncbi:right-handed parallel beta-helix repeat-containing protein [Haloarcula salina]|uniref:Right-handed parallel beta-helix repeat-containing protein n=1 Tax=Haloarcula salina TaxID=1429914 RepID=A0AA41KH43_9EURY|nr:right-handed parallel beta-helix repeat-containing protein [Haloarcula salina]MBV0901346.1 right-handed parallel beta-helix repeat-containing protein [Haloarcula salina]